MFDHPCHFPKPVRAEPVEACASLCFGGSSNKPGVARRQLTFFLRRQKESKQRKRRPDGLGPSASLQATCGARQKRGLARTRLRLKQSRALIRFCLRSSAQPDGWGKEEKDHKPKTEFKSGVLEARSASRTGIPSGGHVCTRAQRTRPHEVPLHRPAGRGRG